MNGVLGSGALEVLWVVLFFALALLGVLLFIAVLRQTWSLRLLAERLDRLEENSDRFVEFIREESDRNRIAFAQNAREDREEISDALHRFNQMVLGSLNEINERSAEQAERLREALITNLHGLKIELEGRSDRLRGVVDEQMKAFQGDARQGREEIGNNVRRFGELLKEQFDTVATTLKHQLETVSGQLGLQLSTLTQHNGQSIEQLRSTMERSLASLQADNQNKLEQIRNTVDEKLHATLEQRLGESFRLVSDRLELVHKGLGEMQILASGVGDLKKVLTNVKVRGIWGEVQLQNLLEQVLTAEQFACNVPTRPGSGERVEFAIKLPGRSLERPVVWLPIDAKFPIEDYQRLIAAQDAGDAAAVELLSRSLEQRIRVEARSIREKYLEPPFTTDFALLFLPIEGLYAEVIRRPGLTDALQREHRITITGPTTLAAILNSLQMGFRTLAIEARSGEVWNMLGEVKTEFQKFAAILEKTRKKLDEARSTIDQAESRSRQISRKLGRVEELPTDAQSRGLTQVPDTHSDDEAPR